jgi:hypothetical protein
MAHWKNHHGSSKNFASKMQSPDGPGVMMGQGTTADLEGLAS